MTSISEDVSFNGRQDIPFLHEIGYQEFILLRDTYVHTHLWRPPSTKELFADLPCVGKIHRSDVSIASGITSVHNPITWVLNQKCHAG